MRITLPLVVGLVATGTCCGGGDLVRRLAERVGVHLPATLGGEPVPVYPNAVRTGGGSTDRVTTATWTVGGVTPQQVIAWYADQVARRGWQVLHRVDAADPSVLQARKDGHKLSVSALDEGGYVMVVTAVE